MSDYIFGQQNQLGFVLVNSLAEVITKNIYDAYKWCASETFNNILFFSGSSALWLRPRGQALHIFNISSMQFVPQNDLFSIVFYAK